MAGAETARLALVVRSDPLADRSARAQLDVALAAAAMDVPLEVYFVGAGARHLLPASSAAGAGLPSAQRAWPALAGLTAVSAWAEPGIAEDATPHGDWGVRPLALADMAERWSACRWVLVL